MQLVTVGQAGSTVEQMAVGPDGKGRLTLPDVGSVSDAVLIVSALAPVTTETASYSFSISAP